MELFPKLDMIGDYYTKALQGSQLCQCRNIILGIHEDDIQAYNASRRDFLGEKKIGERKRRILEGCQTRRQLGRPRSVLYSILSRLETSQR